jgi:hypothetical protein
LTAGIMIVLERNLEFSFRHHRVSVAEPGSTAAPTR